MRATQAQSEALGVVILTGVVLVLVTTVGVFALTNYTESATPDAPLFTCTIEYADDTVTVTHAGGDHVESSTVSVILRNDSGRTRIPLDGVGPRFEIGEAVRIGSVNTTTEVLVSTERDVVCQNTVN